MIEFDRLKICFVAGTLGRGGAERQLFYILSCLRQSGAKIRLLSLTREEFWEQKLKDVGVPVTWVGERPSKMGRLLQIIGELRQDLPRVVQSQHFYTNVYASAAARFVGSTEIGALRNDCRSEVSANGPVLGRLSLKASRVMVANSQAAIGSAVAFGVPADRLFLLPNVVDCQQFRPGHGRSRTAVRLLTVGRLTGQKRVDRFLRILNGLHRVSPVRVQASVVGDGPLRPALEAQAAALGLAPGLVEFTGPVDDVRSIYRESDVLVLTSDWEGRPNALLEAMACGLPVVATSVGGVPEIVVDERTGHLFEPDDEDEAIRVLLALVSDKARRQRLGAQARAYVELHYSLDRLPRMLEQLYEAALS